MEYNAAIGKKGAVRLWTSMKKEGLPEKYHDLWDICCIFRAKMKDMEEVIRMQAVKNPVALSLATEVKKTVARNDVVHDTLDRTGELLQLQNYFRKREQQVAKQAAEQAAKQAAEQAATASMEKMVVMAIQSNATPDVISTMQKGAGITDARLAELKKQVLDDLCK